MYHNYPLLRPHCVTNWQATSTALNAWRTFKKMQVMAHNGSPPETSDDGSRSQDSGEGERSAASDHSGRSQASEDSGRSAGESEHAEASDHSGRFEASEDSGRSSGAKDDGRSSTTSFCMPELNFFEVDPKPCDGLQGLGANAEPNRTETSPGGSHSLGPLLPNCDVNNTCLPVYLDRGQRNSCHFNCMIPVFIAIDQVTPLPLGPEVTPKSSQYFGVVATVGEGMHQKLDSRLKVR